MEKNLNDLGLYEQIFDTSLEGILVVDQNGIIIKANTACESMFGYPPKGLLGKELDCLLPKELKKAHKSHFTDFSKNPKERSMDHELDLLGIKNDGTEFPLRISLVPSTLDKQKVTIAFIRDTIDFKITEYKLKAKEAKHQALLNALPDITVIQDRDGNIEAYFAPEHSVVKTPESEMIGKNIRDVVPEAMAEKILATHNQVITSKKLQIREYSMDLDGQTVDFESRTVLTDHGKLLTIVRDITDKKRTERELKESEAKNRAILKALPDIIFVYDKCGTILQVNASDFSPFLGPIENLVGQNFKEILPPKTSVQILRAIEEVRKTENTVLEVITVPINDTLKDLEIRFVPLENGTFLCIVRDITETKSIQDVLNIRNSALEAAQNSIIIVNTQLPDLPVIYCNDAFCSLTGYDRSEIIGNNCRFLQNDDRDQEGLETLRQAIAAEESCQTILRNYKKDGTLFYNELSITPVRDTTGKLTHYIGIQNDETERIKEIQIKDQLRRILECIAKQDPIEEIGTTIVEVVEDHLECCMASIYKLDPKKQTLHKLAAPNMPEGFCDIIEGAPLGPDIGSCGKAAYLKQEIIVTDITTNPLWKDYHEAAIKYGLNSCWSFPIFSSEQKILGIFGIYCKKRVKPNDAQRDIIADLIQLISIAIEDHLTRLQLEKSHWLLEDYARELEETVNERTNELKVTVQKMVEANLNLENQIRETKRAEIRALENQAMFTSIAKNYPNGVIIVFNATYDIVYIDGRELQRMAMDKYDFEGKNLEDIPVFSEERVQRLKKDIDRTLKGETLSFEIEFANKYFAVNTSPLMVESNEVKWSLFVYNDITQLKLAETEIRKALIREQELNELKSRFISMASHEFRTPLSAIHSSAILIEKQNTPGKEAKREKYVNQIRRNVKALVVILNDFLSLGKLEEGQVRPNPEPMDLVSFTKKSVMEFDPNRKKGQHIKVKTNAKSIVAHLDPKLMHHVLTNLLSNAVKYSHEGQAITVSVEKEQDTVTIKVTDQGIGIPEGEQDQLFERFFRAKNSVNIQGTGLGLNIVKQYTELMGGSIGMESVEGEGSSFWVTFSTTFGTKAD